MAVSDEDEEGEGGEGDEYGLFEEGGDGEEFWWGVVVVGEGGERSGEENSVEDGWKWFRSTRI